MMPRSGKKCLRFQIDKSNEKQFSEFLFNFLVTFGDEVTFCRPLQNEDGVFVTFHFPDKNDELLVKFLWILVIYFKNGTYPGVEKVSFLMGGNEEIKIHPIGTAVS